MNSPVPVFRLDRLFEEQAARTPEAIALLDDDGTMNFAELDSASNRLAAAIRTRNVPEGAFVGIHMERSRHYVASVLGVLKANGAAVPLPPSYPIGRLRRILSFTGLDAVIDDCKSPLDPGLHHRILHASDELAREATQVLQDGNPARPAFVLCSSGSTGAPKMIVRSHRSFFHRLQWTWDMHPYAAGEVCCQKAHMTTTHAVYELFEPLLRGVPVCIISDRETKKLETFWDTIERRGISRLLIVPSVLQASLDMPGFAAPDVRVLVLMGEYLHPELAARTLAAFPGATNIYSIYGSTEASSVLVCDLRESARRGGELPLGKPISPEVRAYVLDDNLQPAAVGAAGMLHIGGPALFSEYFGNPALTERAFIMLDGQRLYRTNDQVRRTGDGSLEFIGRIDHTVKIRGFRVDLQEVEKTISALSMVRQCAVIAKEQPDGSAALVAFVSPADIPAAEVLRALREQLPDYMMPAHVIGLATFPLTLSGKVDRLKLLETDAPLAATVPPVVAGTDTEQRVAGVWKAVLMHDRFQLDSNFFEVGGSSLKTFSVIARLREAFGLERDQLPDDAVYRFPTIRTLASHIDRAREGHASGFASAGSILVTLKSARDAHAAPLFVISSAGGTLGAYEKTIHALKTGREVIGVRDPFLQGARDPTTGFQNWTRLYLNAIRERQPEGPYYLLAYSSAGAFAYEIARQLRCAGEEIALLALVDPLAMDCADERRFGHWAFRARFMRPAFARLIHFAGLLHRVAPRSNQNGLSNVADDFALTREQFLEFETEVRTSRQHVLELSALLELNSGLPFALEERELDSLQPKQYLPALLIKASSAAPEIDPKNIELIAIQYQLQVRTQHRYRLQPFDGTLTLFDPEGPHCGLLASQFAPYVTQLRVHRLALGVAAGRTQELAARFPPSLRSHYLSMRDDVFARALAGELEKLL